MKKVKNTILELTSVFSTRLGRRILLPLILVLALFTIPLFFVFRTEAINDETDVAIQKEDKMREQLYEMQGGMRQEQIAVLEMVYEQKQAALDDFRSAVTRVQTANETAKQNANSSEELLLFENFQSLNEQIQGTVNSDLVPFFINGNSNTLAAVEENVQPSFDRTGKIRAELVDMYAVHNVQRMLRYK
ncbi:MAG: hypothetical protein AABZ63_06290 [Actinomycetota bacterium]